MQNKTTDENVTVSFNGVYQDNYAFLEEMAVPDSYMLELKFHTMKKVGNLSTQ